MATPLPAINSSFGYGHHDRAHPEVSFYFDIVCPYAYLASTQLPALAERVSAVIDWRPILLGGVLKSLGSEPNPAPAAKLAMNRLDVQRWAEHLGVPLHMPAEHPRRTVEAMRLLCWAPAVARQSLALALFRAYWVEGRDIASLDVLVELAHRIGLDGEAARAGLQAPLVRAGLKRRTDDALAAGVFGVPTFVVESPAGPKLFFGQDRLHFVEAALLLHPLAGARPDKDPFRQPVASGGGGGHGDQSPSHAPVANEARTITFFYDFSSPFSFLAATQIEGVAARHGAVVHWHPILLGGLFKNIGTPVVPLHTFSEAKRRHARDDMVRWAHYYDQPFHWPSRFPMMTVIALRLALLAGERIGPLSQALFRAYWVEDGDLNDLSVLEGALVRSGLPAKLLDQSGSPAVKQKLIDNTDSAQHMGVFGAPSFLVPQHDGPPQLFFGQDRLVLVERALERGTASALR